jgi:hypothetical protein
MRHPEIVAPLAACVLTAMKKIDVGANCIDPDQVAAAGKEIELGRTVSLAAMRHLSAVHAEPHPTAVGLAADRRPSVPDSNGNKDTAPSTTDRVDLRLHVLGIKSRGPVVARLPPIRRAGNSTSWHRLRRSALQFDVFRGRALPGAEHTPQSRGGPSVSIRSFAETIDMRRRVPVHSFDCCPICADLFPIRPDL